MEFYPAARMTPAFGYSMRNEYNLAGQTAEYLAKHQAEELLVKYLDRRLPRYTSYPTAVQFGPGVDAATYASWLAALPRDAAISIYLHVPFCAELCYYCGCHTSVARSYAPIAAYTELLKREIALVAEVTGKRPATHVHWGGGTPTMLATVDFLRIMEALRRNFNFTSDAEIAVEIDPRTLTRGYAAVLANGGVTRTSLGVQDFDARVQRAVGRIQSFAQTERVAGWLREARIASVNLDLMYGLPYQTEPSVAASVATALRLDPDRIALFGYAHVPWMKRHQQLIPEQALPCDSERFAQNQTARDLLVGAGYRAIGLDHFAKPNDLLARRQSEGRLHRNFQGYTTDESRLLVGFGPSAIGSLPDGYVQNAPGMVPYRQAISAGKLATARGCGLTGEDRLRRDIIERLMCDFRVDLAAICAAHGTSAARFADELSAIDDLARDEIVERTDNTIRVPDHARPFVRAVCSVFDQYLVTGDTRFSRAS
jgi:oxygen-independent coproporphyrinogen-3 oxidase